MSFIAREEQSLERRMIGVHSGIDVRDDSASRNIKSAVGLSQTNNLRGGLIHIAVGHRVAVVIYRRGVPQALRRRRRARLIGVVGRNYQRLIGLGVDDSVNEQEQIREELGQKALSGPDHEDLVQVAVQIADHGAAVQKADILQPGKTEVRPHDYSGLRALGVRQDLPDGRKEAGQDALGRGRTAPNSENQQDGKSD